MENVVSIIATNSDRLSDLSISNGQLIFIQDKHRIALDFKDERKFYNDIEIFDNDQIRKEIVPENGRFYFVIETAVLWFYQDKWVQLTSTSESVLHIGTILPETGSDSKLYVNKSNRNISVWDNGSYMTVGEITSSVSKEKIDELFIGTI